MPTLTLEPLRTSEGTCDMCGRQTRAVRGAVYSDGEAHAIYFGAWCEHHDDRKVNLAVGIGEWGPEHERADFAMAVEVRSRPEQFEYEVLDPQFSVWNGSGVLGEIASRDEALGDPRRDEIFHVIAHVIQEDPDLSPYLNADSAGV